MAPIVSVGAPKRPKRRNGLVRFPRPPRRHVSRRPANIAGSGYLSTAPTHPSSLSVRNEDELREKARLRMAARRQAMKMSGAVSDETAASIKQAHANYRAKYEPKFRCYSRKILICILLRNAKFLASKQRLRRQNAFIATHGVDAHRARMAAERAKEDAAWVAKHASSMQA
ncbi:hypothetical protein B0H12DRAFT_1083198 [Mycena haematopus]|nr:hypothetical protein B0H12DRAFT_1083198 [Mycena haematopus]